MLLFHLIPLSCAPPQPTLQSLVNARSEQVALDAELGTRLAIATASMSAELGAFDMEDWLEMEGEQISVHQSVEQVLALDGPGTVSVDQSTGAVVVSWEYVEFTPSVWGRVDMDMLRPQTTAILRMEQEPDEPPGVSVEARYALAVRESATSVAGTLVVSLSDREQRVELPNEAETQLVWGEGEGFWPQSGQFTWTETWENAVRSLEALPVDQARPKDLVWPVVVSAEDWSNRVELDLSRAGAGSQVAE